MKKSEALNINVNKATKGELLTAIVQLKSTYSTASKKFDEVGRKSPLLETTQRRMEEHPEIFKRKSLYRFDKNGDKVTELTKHQLQIMYTTYRDYVGHRVFDKQDDNYGMFESNKTATYTGYKKYMSDVAKNVLDLKEYAKMSDAEQKRVWEVIEKTRETIKSTGISYTFQSGTDFKLIASYIKSGEVDPVTLAKIVALGINNENILKMISMREDQRREYKSKYPTATDVEEKYPKLRRDDIINTVKNSSGLYSIVDVRRELGLYDKVDDDEITVSDSPFNLSEF